MSIKQNLSPGRLGKITASSAGAILGFDPHCTRDDVMRRMVREWHSADAEFTGNVATEYGQLHEADAILEYAIETGNTVNKSWFIVHPVHRWLGATPDGLVNWSERLLEVKCPYAKRADKPPTFQSISDLHHYRVQIMVQLACTGVMLCDFFQWSPHGSLQESVKYNHEWFVGDILPELEKFHREYLTERGLQNASKYLADKRKIIDSAHAGKLISEYDSLAESIDIMDGRKKDLLAELVDMATGQDATICGRLLTRVDKKGSVSYAKAIKDLVPDADLEQYRGAPTTFWKLT